MRRFGRPEQIAASIPKDSRPHPLRIRIALLLCGFGAVFQAQAQGPADGALHGIVRNASHQPLSGASVNVQSLGLDLDLDPGLAVQAQRPAGQAQTNTTLRDGSFLLLHLAPGRYEVRIDALGFASVTSEPLDVPPGATLELHATLRPGGLSTLTAEPAANDAPPLPDEDGDGLPSYNGLPANQNSAVLDGMTIIQNYRAVPAGTGSDPAPDPDGDSDSAELATGPANGLGRGRRAGAPSTFAQSSVREFRVAPGSYSAASYSAATGRAGGGMVTAVSRPGTSEFHGDAFFRLRSQAFAAHDPLAVATSYLDGVVSSANPKPHDLREQFGVALGGPILKRHHLVFRYAFEAQRRGYPAISSPADPNFYRLTATQTALLRTRGVTPAAANAALNYVSSLTGETPRRADGTLHFGRVDWHPRPPLTLALEASRVRWTSPAGLIDAPVVARGRSSLGNASGSLDLVQLRLTLAPNPRLFNQLRAGFLRNVQYESPQAPLPQEPAIGPPAGAGSGSSAGSFNLAPEVNIGPNGLLFGTPATLSRLAYPDERRVELGDNLTLQLGRHLLEAGGEIALLHDSVATLANAAGTFRYDSGATRGFAGGLVDFLTDQTFNVNAYPNGGCPSITAATHLFCFRSFTQSFGQTSTSFATADFAAFAQDTWRPRPGLSVHAGVRYEYTLLPLPAAPNATLDSIFGAQGATGVFPEDRNNFGPRAALAWEPFGAGRGILRIGYGVFFGRLPGATIKSALTDTGLPSSTTRIRIRPSTGVVCPQAPTQGFGYPCSFTTQPPGVVAAPTSVAVFDHRFRLPMIQQGTLTLERDLPPLGGRSTSLSATYVLNLDRQLAGSTDLNIAPSISTAQFQLQGGTGRPGVQDGEVFTVPLYTARLTRSFGTVTDIRSDVNATYNGLLVALRSEPARGLRVRAAYTWSKAIDFGQNPSATPRSNSRFDPFTNGYDKALSSLNFPWALRLDAVWTPRLDGGSAWLRGLANGWDFASIVAARSGRPYSLDISGGTLLPGGHLSINGSGGALYLPTVGRNTLRLPATFNTDLRASRGFRAGPHLRLESSVEVFNLFNHRNVASVAQRAFLVGTRANGITPLIFQDASAIAAEGLTTQPFGTPTAASTSLARERQLQLSLRLNF